MAFRNHFTYRHRSESASATSGPAAQALGFIQRQQEEGGETGVTIAPDRGAYAPALPVAALGNHSLLRALMGSQFPFMCPPRVTSFTRKSSYGSVNIKYGISDCLWSE